MEDEPRQDDVSSQVEITPEMLRDALVVVGCRDADLLDTTWPDKLEIMIREIYTAMWIARPVTKELGTQAPQRRTEKDQTPTD